MKNNNFDLVDTVTTIFQISVGLIVVVLIVIGFTDILFNPDALIQREATTKILEDQGYTNVEITGYSYSGCGDDDQYHTGFSATSPITGRQVQGVACSGIYKGLTLRFN